MHSLKELNRALGHLAEARSRDFSELVKAAGLDPAADFQSADLSGADLRGEDLRVFDFRNAAFRGARIHGTQFNQSVTREQLAAADPHNRMAVLQIGEGSKVVTSHLLRTNKDIFYDRQLSRLLAKYRDESELAQSAVTQEPVATRGIDAEALERFDELLRTSDGFAIFAQGNRDWDLGMASLLLASRSEARKKAFVFLTAAGGWSNRAPPLSTVEASHLNYMRLKSVPVPGRGQIGLDACIRALMGLFAAASTIHPIIWQNVMVSDDRPLDDWKSEPVFAWRGGFDRSGLADALQQAVRGLSLHYLWQTPSLLRVFVSTRVAEEGALGAFVAEHSGHVAVQVSLFEPRDHHAGIYILGADARSSIWSLVGGREPEV